MFSYRRVQRGFALACTTAALAAAPAAAVAMPVDPVAAGPDGAVVESRRPSSTVVREVEPGGGDQTLALVISGAALLVALGGAGYASRTGHRIGQPSH